MSVYGKRGVVVRVLYLMGATTWYLLTAGGRAGHARRVVLCYHGIQAEYQESFRRQMASVAGRAAVNAVGNGRRRDLTGCPASVYITFDDAFENLLENALPVLDEFGIPAVIFVVPGNLGQTPRWSISPSHPEYDERVMTAEQLRQISSRNVVIGSHTQTHPDLSELPAEQIWWELTESKRSLEEIIGRPVEDLALPFGSYNRDVLQMALEAGYKRIYTLDPKPAEPAGEGPVVGRFSMSLDVWRIEFVLTCAGAYAWLYPWWRCIRRVREWRHRSAE